MPLPTLLIKGSLRSPSANAEQQKMLDEFVPIDYILEWFRVRLDKTGITNRVLILKAETASGKSTSFPAELFIRAVSSAGVDAPGIICTQPRILTAIVNVTTIVRDSGPEYPRFLKIGDTIGWATGVNKLKPKRRGLLSATIGILAMQLQTLPDEEIMKLYKYILIDETHERDL